MYSNTNFKQATPATKEEMNAERSIDSLSKEMLKYCSGDLDCYDQIIDMVKVSKENYYLNKHPYKITESSKDAYWRTYLPDSSYPNGRRLLKRKFKKDLINDIVEYWQSREQSFCLLNTAKAAIEDRWAKGFIKDSTKTRYLSDADRFFSAYAEYDIKGITIAKAADLIEVIVSKTQPSRKGYNNLISLLRLLFKYARRSEIINISVDDVLDEVDIPDRLFSSSSKDDSAEVFTKDELGLLKQYLINHLDNKNLCLLLVAVTGCRIGEMTTAKHSDFTESIFNVSRTQTRSKGSDGKYHYEVTNAPKTVAGFRNVPIPMDYQWLIDKTKEFNQDSEFIFLDKYNKPYSSNVMNNRLKKICKTIGIPPRSPHKLRKTYASILCDNGIPEKTIIKVMGHTDIRTTNTYYNRNRESNDQICEKISAIEELKMA